MAERAFDTLIPRVSVSAPGCPNSLILNAIRNTAIRTCERTLYWRHAETPYDLTPAVHEYFYRKPQGADVHAVLEATVNGYPLDRVTMEEAFRRYPSWADLYSGVPYDQLWTDTGAYNTTEFNENAFNGGSTFVVTDDALEDTADPLIFTQITTDKFVVLPSPSDEKPFSLRLVYALKPKRTADGMPEYMFDELEDAIYHGTLQELMVVPNQPWKDLELAAYHAKQYNYCVTERRARINLGNMRGTVYVQMRPFG
jgi:hypothetical protein